MSFAQEWCELMAAIFSICSATLLLFGQTYRLPRGRYPVAKLTPIGRGWEGNETLNGERVDSPEAAAGGGGGLLEGQYKYSEQTVAHVTGLNALSNDDDTVRINSMLEKPRQLEVDVSEDPAILQSRPWNPGDWSTNLPPSCRGGKVRSREEMMADRVRSAGT
ncbi:hypothetical protein BGZ61DRAFT_79178 [Ilyonectria robusta]|uniref:uncharacterized protein n=1 Tax=Ilyonectria robusta TaxID=1079257 RepID=UPI001E8DBB9A|nr:uncharacterized protein BGZ61DRAFT_79178 [Ilyonectria robusta]KAH8735444.1 hypothetical protein BGZ61DRAFT_79178 [Ilyonectria robusta]